MSQNTNIQWCHSTVNPIMGCGGCELFSYPKEILDKIDSEVAKICKSYKLGHTKRYLKQCVVVCQLGQSELLKLTTTNIYHLRKQLAAELEKVYGQAVADCALRVIEQSVTCYAAKLHLNKAKSILNPYRSANPGYAPTFEEISQFSSRVAQMARMSDLRGVDDPQKPWMVGLPRLIFVSDMGDAFSRKEDEAFLKSDVISGGNRSELFRPFNKHLKSKFLPDAGRPSYELRKFYASASNLAVGLKTTHKRMGHKNSATTEDHYIDKDTSQELVDLYEKYAKELFGDIAFPK